MNPQAEKLKNEGNNYFKHQQYGMAASCYLQAIELDPNNAIYYSNLAACQIAIGEYDDAITASEKAIQLSPQYEKAHFRLIQAYSENSEGKKALEALRMCYRILVEKHNNSIPIETQRAIEQKANEVRKGIIQEKNTRMHKKILVQNGKFKTSNLVSIAELLDKVSLKTNGKCLSMMEIFDLVSDFELEDLSEVDSFNTAKEIVSACLKPEKQNELTVGLERTVDEKYIKNEIMWNVLVVPTHGLKDAPRYKKLRHCPAPSIRPISIQLYEVHSDRIIPLVVETASYKHKHKKFGYGLLILRSLALAIIKSHSNSSQSKPQFLPERLMIYGADYFKSRAETIVNYGLITQLPFCNNVMQLSKDMLPKMLSESLEMTNRLYAPEHPFIKAKGLRSTLVSRGEYFTIEFGTNLFGALAELASLEPWKYISILYPLHVSISHSRISENIVPTPSENLNRLLKNDHLGIEGLEFMDGRERVVCVMGCTDPNATGFSILKDMKDFSTFVRNPNLIPEIPSVQYGTISNISMDDLDDIKAYAWPVYKGHTYNFYPFIVTILKNFFITMDDKLLRRSELKDLKWIEAFCRGLSQFIRKCVKHPPLRGMDDHTNFLVTDEFTKSGVKVQTTDGEAVVKIIVGKDTDDVVKSTSFHAETDEEASEKLTEITKEWKKEMENEKTSSKACAVCGTTTAELGKKLLVCGKCKKVHYCSRDCQGKDWPAHKKVCNK